MRIKYVPSLMDGSRKFSNPRSVSLNVVPEEEKANEKPNSDMPEYE